MTSDTLIPTYFDPILSTNIYAIASHPPRWFKELIEGCKGRRKVARIKIQYKRSAIAKYRRLDLQVTVEARNSPRGKEERRGEKQERRGRTVVGSHRPVPGGI